MFAHVNPLAARAHSFLPALKYPAPADVSDAAPWIVCLCAVCLVSVVKTVVGTCRGSLAFSNGSDALSDASSAAKAGRGAYGLTMGEGGSGGIGRGGQSARRGGTALFEGAPSEAGDSRRAGKSNIFGTMAFSDVEKENEVCNILQC